MSDIMKKAIKDEDEIIARFGGEEFMMMIKADSKDTAFKRIDEARQAFEDKKWDVDVYLRITFSAGLIHLKEYDNITQALSAADRLLYLAKELDYEIQFVKDLKDEMDEADKENLVMPAGME